MPDEHDPPADELAARRAQADSIAAERAAEPGYAELHEYLHRSDAQMQADIARMRAEAEGWMKADVREIAEAAAAGREPRTAAQIERDIRHKIQKVNEQILAGPDDQPAPTVDNPHAHVELAEVPSPELDLDPMLDAIAVDAVHQAATAEPEPTLDDHLELANQLEDQISQLDVDFDLAIRARDIAHGRVLEATPENRPDRLREYKATNELVEHLEDKLTAAENRLSPVEQAIAAARGPEDPPEAELGLDPPTPRPSRDPSGAEAEIEHDLEPPTPAPDFHPEAYQLTANPTAENLASMSAALDYRDTLEANARALGSESSNACAIAMRTFPDAHAAAARGPEHSIQASARHGAGKKLSKTLKRGGRR